MARIGRGFRVAVAALAASCGGDGSDGAAPDAGDASPPEIRSAQLMIDGDLGVNIDFSSRDEDHVLPRPATGVVVVRARDDAGSGRLEVEVIGAGGEPVAGQEPTFDSGLWRIATDLEPGRALRVRVRDPAGNEVTSAHRVSFPALSEALAGSWETRFYDPEQTVTHRWTSDFAADNSWSQDREDTGIQRSGTFAVTGTSIAIGEAVRTGGANEDTDPDTVEERVESTLYVDSRYASVRPYARAGDGSDHVGTWERSWSVHRPDGGQLVLAEEISETLVLEEDGSWSKTREVVDHTGAEPATTTTTRAGSYTIELNDDYTDAAGNFLARMVETVDGEPAAGEPLFDLHVIRLGYLLVQPRLRAD